MSSPQNAHFVGGYTTRQVSRLLDIPDYVVRGFVRSGLVFPRRGRRREFRSSFQDLVVLRSAVELSRHVSTRRVRRALKLFRERLPKGRSLSTLQVTTVGDEVVVRDGEERWNASGQRLFNFEVAELVQRAAPLARLTSRKARESKEDRMDVESWFEMACELEPVDPSEAIEAYLRVLRLEPDHCDAHINLGRLRHEMEQFEEAVAHYRRALASRPRDVIAAFNLGVALEDLDRVEEAIEAYLTVVQEDDSFADAHFNLARLYELEGMAMEALRHLTVYRNLLRSPQQ